ncbi:MAG: UMP kinase, partial [Pseudomonadota bacterium]
ALFKGTQVDGVYSDDPKTNPEAERYDSLNYFEVLTRDLRVMDQAAISLTRENGIPIVVFSIHDRAGFVGALTGAGVRTVISDTA